MVPELPACQILWVVRMHMWIEKRIPSPIVASAIPFALPITAAGIVIARIYAYPLFTRGVIFALVWLAIAPFLLRRAHREVFRFLKDSGHLYWSSGEGWETVYSAFKEFASPKYLTWTSQNPRGSDWCPTALSAYTCSTPFRGAERWRRDYCRTSTARNCVVF